MSKLQDDAFLSAKQVKPRIDSTELRKMEQFAREKIEWFQPEVAKVKKVKRSKMEKFVDAILNFL
jgi:hypothetical protein